MDSNTRKAKLAELKENSNNIYSTGIPLQYKGENRIENVYKIPLEYLIYNKHNGRIGSEVLSYEKQHGILNPEEEADKEIIESFLFKSKEERNKTTRDSLFKNGQQRHGIVTSDGIIIDGNRRAMLLNQIYHKRTELGYSYVEVEKCKYFNAIILPDDAVERDIQQLETIYQMGEDDKLDYNPIEKYLKCKGLKNHNFTIDDIAGFMSEKPAKIEEWLQILTLMEEFLEQYGYEGIYTRLEKTEGPFVDLNGYITSYKKRGANVRNIDWDYGETDISDLKLVCFDYIRARYEGKEFRDIAKTGKDGSLFFYKDIWDAFLTEHQDNLPEDEETVEELRNNNPNEDLSMLLRRRDNEWEEKAKNHLKGNLRKHVQKLDFQRAANKPADLIERALSALQAVDTNQDSFYEDPQISDMLREIGRIQYSMKKLLGM